MSGYGFTSAGTSYDDEDRLTGFARTSGTFTQSWNLTKVGDWTSVTTNGTAQNRTHGPTHELLTAGGQNISTDVKGNITLLPANLTPQNAALGLQWDFDNKLRSADLGNNSSVDVNFQYDALGRRVARTGTGGSVVYVQHDQQTIADYPVGGVASTPTNRYVYASYIDEPVVRKAAGTSGTIHYYHRNQQYSITAMTTSTGAVAERYAYTAYGQPTICNASGSPIGNQQSQIANRFTYTGREWDETLGLHHFRARWMSPIAGRFLERDPLQLITTTIGKYSIDFAPSKVDPSRLFSVDLKTTVVDQSCFGCGNFQSYIETKLENVKDPISDTRSEPVAFVVQKMVQIRCQRKGVSECGCYPDPKSTWTCCSWESEELIEQILSGNGRAFFVAPDGLAELEKIRDHTSVINPDKGNYSTDGECIEKGVVFAAHDIRVYEWTPELDAMWKRNKRFYKDTGCGYSILQMEGPSLADDVQTIGKSAAVIAGSWNCCPKSKSGHCNFGGLGYRVREKQPLGED